MNQSIGGFKWTSETHSRDRAKAYVSALVVLVGMISLLSLDLSLSLGPVSDYYSAASQLEPTPHCDTRGLRTVVRGDTAGSHVLDNIWFRRNTFYVHESEDSLHLAQDKLVSYPAKLARSRTPLPDPDVCFEGTTLWINENKRKTFSPIDHYYHFAAEDILGGVGALSLINVTAHDDDHCVALTPAGLLRRQAPTIPDRVIIPWERQWQDRWGMNALVAGALCGDAEVIDKRRFEKHMRRGDGWVFLERG